MKRDERDESEPAVCKNEAHYWILDDKSFGVCKKCGAKRQFVVEGFGWQNRNVVIGKTARLAGK